MQRREVCDLTAFSENRLNSSRRWKQEAHTDLVRPSSGSMFKWDRYLSVHSRSVGQLKRLIPPPVPNSLPEIIILAHKRHCDPFVDESNRLLGGGAVVIEGGGTGRVRVSPSGGISGSIIEGIASGFKCLRRTPFCTLKSDGWKCLLHKELHRDGDQFG